ncbi:MAG: hypothetical protein AAGF76_04610, partial [Pseudomonadota bacterium]
MIRPGNSMASPRRLALRGAFALQLGLAAGSVPALAQSPSSAGQDASLVLSEATQDADAPQPQTAPQRAPL